MKNFPARLKTYQSFEFVQRLLKGYLKVNMTVTELKSEALKVIEIPYCAIVITSINYRSAIGSNS